MSACRNEVPIQQGTLTFASGEQLYTYLKDHNRSILWSLELPHGSSVQVVDGKMTVRLPQGVKLVGVVKGTNTLEEVVLAGGVQCTCTAGDGSCIPFIAGDVIGCATQGGRPCSKCIMTTNHTAFERYCRVYAVHDWEGSLAQSLQYFLPINNPADVAAVEQATPVTKDILSEPKVQETLQQMLNTISSTCPQYSSLDCSGGKVPRGHVLVPLMVMEHVAYMVLPKEKVEKGMIELLAFRAPHLRQHQADAKVPPASLASTEIEPDGVYCTGACNSSCRLETMFLGRVKYCTGCSSGCTLHY
ncbi:MAG: hypothetical protein RML40_09760 [Bacteroidota bacterium]|nr:hypothetical protein [Candidatus Kapabacteria bacterium]MDW8220803.1 hypothetical protein [Bacteroidota bacterium]